MQGCQPLVAHGWHVGKWPSSRRCPRRRFSLAAHGQPAPPIRAGSGEPLAHQDGLAGAAVTQASRGRAGPHRLQMYFPSFPPHICRYKPNPPAPPPSLTFLACPSGQGRGPSISPFWRPQPPPLGPLLVGNWPSPKYRPGPNHQPCHPPHQTARARGTGGRRCG